MQIGQIAKTSFILGVTPREWMNFWLDLLATKRANSISITTHEFPTNKNCISREARKKDYRRFRWHASRKFKSFLVFEMHKIRSFDILMPWLWFFTSTESNTRRRVLHLTLRKWKKRSRDWGWLLNQIEFHGDCLFANYSRLWTVAFLFKPAAISPNELLKNFQSCSPK